MLAFREGCADLVTHLSWMMAWAFTNVFYGAVIDIHRTQQINMMLCARVNGSFFPLKL